MPCQGPAHIQQSQATQKAVDLECSAAQSVRFSKSIIGDHMHVRSHP